MKRFYLYTVVLLFFAVNSLFAQNKIGMFIGASSVNDIPSADEKAAAQWFQSAYTDGIIYTPSTISSLSTNDVSVLWVEIDRVGIAQGWNNLPDAFISWDALDALEAFVKAGGNLLLTNHATQLTVAIDRIAAAYAPGIFGSGTGSQQDETWGVHPVIGNVDGQIYDHRDHPIYNGMTYQPELFAGIYTFEGAGIKGDHNCMWDLNAYGLAANPNVVKAWEETTSSTVLGTWNHVVDYCCAGIVDFEPTTALPGRILAVGLAAYEWDLGGSTNSEQAQLEMFTANCLRYLSTTDDAAEEPLPAVSGKVGLLIGSESVSDITDDDELAAAQWFQSTFTDGTIVTPSTLNTIKDLQTLWVAIDRNGIAAGASNLPSPYNTSDVINAIADHVKAGGSLLLTNHATQLLTAIGRISDTYAPNIFGSSDGGSNDDIWGVNAQIGCNPDLDNHYDHSGHDIFTGMAKNNTTYGDHSFFPLIGSGNKEDHNCMWDFNAEGYALDDNPDKLADFESKTSSIVLGTWQHVTDYACAGLIEFLPTGDFKGTIIANGLAAYEWNQNDKANSYQTNMDYLTRNSINYLNSVASKSSTPTAINSATLKDQVQMTNDNVIYDLSGRKVASSQLPKGIYIKNNQKVAIK